MDANKFWSKVDKQSEDGCWLWTGAKTYDGYGVILVKAARKQTTVCVHRLVWEQLRGPIPEGLHLDHLCKVRSCVNPDHLEIVTPKENVARSNLSGPTPFGGCRRNHDLTVDSNRYIDENGKVKCRICYLASLEPWRVKKREAAKQWRSRRRMLKQSGVLG